MRVAVRQASSERSPSIRIAPLARVMWKAAPDSDDCAWPMVVVPIVHKAMSAGSRRERMDGSTVNVAVYFFTSPVLAVSASRLDYIGGAAHARDHTWRPGL